MNCPKCGEKTKVIETRSDCESVARRRACKDCGYIFYTIEYEESNAEGQDIMKDFYRNYRAEKRGEK